jgi:hypothetical protein
MIPRRIAFLLLLAAAPVSADNPERGRLLYENFCYHCHMTEIHFRVNSKIDTWERLRETVRIWQGEMGLGWRAEDILDVSGFLNSRYYQLPGAAVSEQ